MEEPPYTLQRLGVIMAPDSDDPMQAWGVLNPACARARDGDLWLFPRLVAKGNYSRIGRALVSYDGAGAPAGVGELGVVLSPDESWEQNAGTSGVEDPRITFIETLDVYVMAYSAYGPLGSRIGLAYSADLAVWHRLGPASFAYDPSLRADLNLYANKDAMLFPEVVAAPDGTPSYAMLHRPVWDLSWIRPGEREPLPAGLHEARPGIWVSFVPALAVEADLVNLPRFTQHRLVALPEKPWEALKIGGGTPPVRVPEGWLILHHGVDGNIVTGRDLQPGVLYSAGAMLLDVGDVSRVVARSNTPLLEPSHELERDGIVPNVVFPTGIDVRADGSADVFYGMADSRIGAARLTHVDAAPA